MMRERFRLGLNVTIVMGLAFMVAACAQLPTPMPTPTPAPRPSPNEVLAKAQQAMSQVLSYTLTGDVVVENEEGRQEARINGEWVAPDRWHQTVEGGDGRVSELVAVGGRVFTRDSDRGGGAWEEQPRRPTPPPGNSILDKNLEDLQILQDGMIDDVPVFNIRGVTKTTTACAVAAGHSLFISKTDCRLMCMVTDSTMPPDDCDDPKARQEDQIATRAVYYFHNYDIPIIILTPPLP
jgi:hypothetical protein